MHTDRGDCFRFVPFLRPTRQAESKVKRKAAESVEEVDVHLLKSVPKTIADGTSSLVYTVL
jgi:hypothetical protein